MILRATGVCHGMGTPFVPLDSQDEVLMARECPTRTGNSGVSELAALVRSREEWLIDRVLFYAKRQDFTKYTSTLKEAWRVSIQGLSEAILQAVATTTETPELGPDDSFIDDPVASFGIQEAGRHRQRGVPLSMFLGLFKYYRQTYADLVRETGLNDEEQQVYLLYLSRVFDRIEIAFVSTWSDCNEQERLSELQHANRQMTNEKNKYLTAVESLATPVFFLSDDARVEYVNHAAARLLGVPEIPGGQYYSRTALDIRLPEWLHERMGLYYAGKGEERCFEHTWEVGGQVRSYLVQISMMSDVSDKFSGAAVVLHDITARKEVETQLARKAVELEKRSLADPLTGLYNRRGFELLAERQLTNTKRTGQGFHLLYGDLDGLKSINDRFGHKTGDDALVATAENLRASFRQSDVVARLGGDEFVVLLTTTSRAEASAYTSRLMANLEAFTGTADHDFQLRMSVGLVEYDASRHGSLDDVIAEADQLMYQAKRKRHQQQAGQPAPTAVARFLRHETSPAHAPA